VTYQNLEIKFTVSLGVCELSKSVETAQQWLELADQGLYESKESGRNKTSAAKPKEK